MADMVVPIAGQKGAGLEQKSDAFSVDGQTKAEYEIYFKKV